MRLIDLTKLSPFGRLTVLSRVPNKGRRTAWQCRCACGNAVVVTGHELQNGNTQSCGCLKHAILLTLHQTHGQRSAGQKSAEYKTWLRMKSRTMNPKDPHFPDYGGRGIRICKGWDKSFESFYQDIGSTYPGPHYSIDRRKNDGHYSCGHCEECLVNGWPANCRWATAKEQGNNRRCSKFVTFRGETKTIAQWAEMLHLTTEGMSWRLKHRSLEEALTGPLRSYLDRRGK